MEYTCFGAYISAEANSKVSPVPPTLCTNGDAVCARKLQLGALHPFALIQLSFVTDFDLDWTRATLASLSTRPCIRGVTGRFKTRIRGVARFLTSGSLSGRGAGTINPLIIEIKVFTALSALCSVWIRKAQAIHFLATLFRGLS